MNETSGSTPVSTPNRRTFLPATRKRGVILNDDKLLQQARLAKNGDKFSALFDRGDLSFYSGAPYRADLALCRMLSFWTGDDSARIDRLFRLSALMREKWDEKHGPETYGSRTIRKVVSDERREQ